jgi:hypothetical protein
MSVINAVIKRPNLIVANTVPLTTSQSNAPVTLKNNGSSINQNYIHSLLDVVEDHPQNGATLVYNSTTNKYEVKQVTAVVTGLDGGLF